MSNTVASPGWWRPRTDDALPLSVVAHSGEDRNFRLAFWALGVFTVVMILAPQNYFPILKPLHIALLSGALASAAYLMSRFTGTEMPARHSPAMMYAVFLFLWAVLLVPFSVWPGGSFGKIFDVFIKALIIFWLLGRVVNSIRRLSVVVWMLSLMSIPLSLSAVLAFLQGGIGNVELTHGWERITGYHAGLTGNPNDLALMINLTLPLTVGLMLSARKRVAYVSLLFVALLDVIAVVLTYSRGGFITLMVIVGSYLVCLTGRVRIGLIMIVLAVGLVAVPMIPSGYWSRLGTITDIRADRTDSAQQRWSLMVDATRLVVSHPIIGAGAGMDILALNEEGGDTWRHVHNIYLQYAVDLGLPGLLLFLLLYYRVMKSVSMARRRAAGRPEHATLHRLSEGIWIALIAFGVSAFFHPVAYEFYFYYFAGLAVAAGAIAETVLDQGVGGRRIEACGA